MTKIVLSSMAVASSMSESFRQWILEPPFWVLAAQRLDQARLSSAAGFLTAAENVIVY
jgi:hypothetical protein